MLCDLHTHSVFSDGTYLPEEIIKKAKELGLEAVALTDHNTVAGLPDFMEAAKNLGVTAVGGVELSTNYDGIEFHLLGLFISPDRYDDVERLCKEFHVLKEISNIDTIERLNNAGYNVSYADIRKKNPTGNVNRAHIAAELLRCGYVKSISEAFDTILGDDFGFYVPPLRLQLIDAIKFLRDIAAVPVIAHPLQDTDADTLRALLPSAIEAGLMGIETLHSSYDEETVKTATAIAEEHSLLMSGGSDFHGDNKPDISLATGKGGLRVSGNIYRSLLSASALLRGE